MWRYMFRALPGTVFLFSAVAKLISIDSFEIYIFGLQFLSLSAAYLAARLIIALEFFLGVALLTNFYPRFALSSSVSLLGAFTIFLCVLSLSGNEDNCHCFGDLVSLSPGASIFKNIALIVLLLTGYRVRPFTVPHPMALTISAALLCLAAVFIISPPDNWRYESYSRSTTLNEEAFSEALCDGTLPQEITEGDCVVCFYSLNCQYCKLSAKKISTMRHNGTFSRAPLIAIIGKGEHTGDPGPFFEETHLDCSSCHFISPERFLRITNGAMPLILVLHEGNVVEKYSYRDIR